MSSAPLTRSSDWLAVYALVCAIEGGMSLKAAAACFSVSPATAHRWWHRWLDGDRGGRVTLPVC